MFKKIKNYLFLRKIKKNGIYAPVILTKDGNILDGNRRIWAAKKLGIKVPAVILNANVVLFDPNKLNPII
jgi:ParB-like chromosome segregation protein Spo0J